MKPVCLRLTPLVAAMSFCSQAAQAADPVPPYYLAPMASYVLADDGRGSGDALGGVLALGAHLTPLVDVELLGSYLSYKGKGATQKFAREAGGVGVNVYLYRGDDGSGPFIHGDVMGVDRSYFNYGLGYDFMFGKGGFGLRAEALLHNDGFQYHEGQFNLGLRIPFGKQPVAVAMPPPPPPPPAEVALIEPPAPPPPPPPPAPCVGSGSGQTIDLSGCKMGDNIVLRGVNFDFDKDALTVNAKVILDQVVDALKRRPDIKVEIGGHTDAKGTVPYNRKLSERRAASVKNYLIAQGIEADRMTAVGYGKVVAIADNDTDEGRELNRRVELTVTAADPTAGGVVTEQAGMPDAVAVAPVAVAEAPAEAPAPAAAPAAAVSAASAVSISNYLYVPGKQTVAVGGTVTWTNNDPISHTVKFDDGDIKIKAGQTYTRTFSSPGTVTYRCGIHPDMSGSIEVVAP
jgi:outer membrane protein OmpA-like peptidoglycan-associated protein/plastocyanin